MNKVALFAIIGTAMFLLSGATAFAATPSSTTVHIQPNPTLNTNITWSSFNSSWGELEYYNGTAYNNLSASPSTVYKNSIAVNPTDLIAPGVLQNDKTGGNIWNSASNTTTGGYTTGNGIGTVHTSGTFKDAGVNEYYLETNTTAASGVSFYIAPPAIPATEYPSANPAYDYLTVAYELHGNALNGAEASTQFHNGSASTITEYAQVNQPVYYSLSLAQIHAMTGLGYNITGTQTGSEIAPLIYINLPETATNEEFNLTLTAYSMTDYPIILGQNSTGAAISQTTGNAHLSSFKPSVPMTVIDGGYTAAVSQPLQNLTTQQNAISSGNYIEQVEYQGLFDLPTAPDLSYGPANLTEAFNISTTQTQVLDINGVSYLSTISGKNGTVQLLSSVNPNSQSQFLQIVDYTQSQWNSISVAPGIFTIAGIEYYWWIAVGGLATLIGLAAAAKHAGTKADQERIRRGR